MLLMSDRCLIEISFFLPRRLFCPSSLKENPSLVSDPPEVSLGPAVSLLLFYPLHHLDPSSTFRFPSLSGDRGMSHVAHVTSYTSSVEQVVALRLEFPHIFFFPSAARWRG